MNSATAIPPRPPQTQGNAQFVSRCFNKRCIHVLSLAFFVSFFAVGLLLTSLGFIDYGSKAQIIPLLRVLGITALFLCFLFLISSCAIMSHCVLLRYPRRSLSIHGPSMRMCTYQPANCSVDCTQRSIMSDCVLLRYRRKSSFNTRTVGAYAYRPANCSVDCTQRYTRSQGDARRSSVFQLSEASYRQLSPTLGRRPPPGRGGSMPSAPVDISIICPTAKVNAPLPRAAPPPPPSPLRGIHRFIAPLSVRTLVEKGRQKRTLLKDHIDRRLNPMSFGHRTAPKHHRFSFGLEFEGDTSVDLAQCGATISLASLNEHKSPVKSKNSGCSGRCNSTVAINEARPATNFELNSANSKHGGEKSISTSEHNLYERIHNGNNNNNTKCRTHNAEAPIRGILNHYANELTVPTTHNKHGRHRSGTRNPAPRKSVSLDVPSYDTYFSQKQITLQNELEKRKRTSLTDFTSECGCHCSTRGKMFENYFSKLVKKPPKNGEPPHGSDDRKCSTTSDNHREIPGIEAKTGLINGTLSNMEILQLHDSYQSPEKPTTPSPFPGGLNVEISDCGSGNHLAISSTLAAPLRKITEASMSSQIAFIDDNEMMNGPSTSHLATNDDF